MDVKFTLLILLLVLNSCSCFENVVGKIKSGIEIAGKLLGFDETTSVAKLVSDAFGNSGKKANDSHKNNIFSGFLRILGLDTKKISAMAVNAIIFVAQLISTSLSKPPPSELTAARSLDGTPMDWLMNNSHASDLISYAHDEKLPENVIEYIKERSVDEESDCIQLLICKTKPFIWGMQKGVTEGFVGKGAPSFFSRMPSLNEVADYGDTCEMQHRYCRLHD